MASEQTGATGVGVFLAHALALELESARRYAELAAAASAGPSAGPSTGSPAGAGPQLAALFNDLAHHSRCHADEVRAIGERSGGIPRLQPWQLAWYGGESPLDRAAAGPRALESARNALEAALAIERQARDYYQGVSQETGDPEVARLALAFARTEEEHVALIGQWLGQSDGEAA